MAILDLSEVRVFARHLHATGRHWQGEILGRQAEYTPERRKKPELEPNHGEGFILEGTFFLCRSVDDKAGGLDQGVFGLAGGQVGQRGLSLADVVQGAVAGVLKAAGVGQHPLELGA